MALKKKVNRLRAVKRYKPEKPIKAVVKTIPKKAISKANKGRKRSSLELFIYSILNEEDIVFKKEKVIGRCHVDIFIEPNIVLEVNGSYWHRCKCCYPENTKENMEIRMRDVKRYAFFRSKGFEVHTIKECDVKNNLDKVREHIKSLKPIKED
jgi:very-short-patch-repair endonuclease